MDKQTEDFYFRQLDCMLHYAPGWSIDNIGFDNQGMGDLIYRTAIFAIVLQDWELLLNCIVLLRNYKRWPDWLEPGRKKRKELRKAGFKRIRGQRSMTRDPYIMTLSAIALMEDINDEQRRGWYKQVKIPFWMNRANLFWYKKTLLDPKHLDKLERVMLRDYRRRVRQDPRRVIWKEKKQKARDNNQAFREWWFDALQKILGYPGYVKFLHAFMTYTTGAKRVQTELWKVTPHWNYGILLLTEKPTMYLARDFIEKWVARDGFQWSGEKVSKNKILPESEKYKMEKDLLDYLWNRYNKDPEPFEY